MISCTVDAGYTGIKSGYLIPIYPVSIVYRKSLTRVYNPASGVVQNGNQGALYIPRLKLPLWRQTTRVRNRAAASNLSPERLRSIPPTAIRQLWSRPSKPGQEWGSTLSWYIYPCRPRYSSDPPSKVAEFLILVWQVTDDDCPESDWVAD